MKSRGLSARQPVSSSSRDGLLALLAAATAFCAFVLALRLRGANNLYEFCHYADIARNWAGGAGYSTRIIEPGVLAELEARGLPFRFPFPVTYRFPLYSLLVTLSIKLFGFSDAAVALVNGLVHAALAGLIVWLGRRYFDLKTAVLAGLLYAASPVFAARYAISGFTDPLLALTLLPLHFLLAKPGRWTGREAAAAGAWLGLSYLARFNVVLFIPVYLALVWRKSGPRGAALFCAAAAALAVPLWAYNLRAFGALSAYPMATMNLAAFTSVWTSDPWRLYGRVSLGDIILHHWGLLALKTFRGLFGEFLPALATLWNLPLFCLLCFAGPRSGESDGARTLRRLSVGLLLLQGLAFSPMRLELTIPNEYYRGRYFFWFAPTLLLCGSAALLRLSAAFKRSWPAIVLVLASVLVEFGDFHPAGYHFDPRSDPSAAVLSRLPPGSTILVSNVAVQAAAYFGLNSVELPLNPTELRKLLAAHPASHIYIDGDYFLNDDWRALLTNGPKWLAFQREIGFRHAATTLNERHGFRGELLAAAPAALGRPGSDPRRAVAFDSYGAFSGPAPRPYKRRKARPALKPTPPKR